MKRSEVQWQQVVLAVKVLSSEMTDLERADGFNGPAGKSGACVMVSAHCPPGVLGRVELQSVFTVTREIRQSASIIESSFRTSVKSEGEGIDCRKSEVSIVARKSGNADGAKGHRFEITGEGYMYRH